MIVRTALCILTSLWLACSPDPSPDPDPDPAPSGPTTGDSEEAQSAEPTPEALSHDEALELLRAADVQLTDIANQDCAPVGEGLTVAALVEESAANALEQTTECAPDGAGQRCTTEFANNSGDEMEEFYVKLEYRVEGGAIVEWRGCLFAG